MVFIPLTQKQNNTPIWVNMNNITSFIGSGTGTRLRFNDGSTLGVETTETISELIKLLGEAPD
jgi:DNA-binding LytR/AlgR family response regulator